MQHLIRWLNTPPALWDRPCWKEILESAIVGRFPIGQELEQMLDHLERKQ